MSKRMKSIGRKLKNLSDPSLAHSHKEGANVLFMLTSVDPKWGRYLYCQYRRYGLILNQSLKYYKKSIKLLNECRQLKVQEKTGFRNIPDNLRDNLEINTMQFLILTKLGLEYLFTEYESAIKQIKKHRKENYDPPLDTEDLGSRLKKIKDAIEVKSEIPRQVYTILDRRDIVEHPTTQRLWEGSETGWKTVNLSWVLCGEIDGIISPIVIFVNEFVKKVEAYIKDNPIPGTLNGLTRGLKAGEQFKKPNPQRSSFSQK
jgi:hypothetical protein